MTQRHATIFDQYQRAAEALGLAYHKGEGLAGWTASLEGIVDGERVRSETVANITTHVFRNPPGDIGLSITRAGLTAKIGGLFGVKDVQVGDAAFDAAFVVHAKDPHRAIALLDEPVRAALWTILRSEVDFEVTDAEVRLKGTCPSFPFEGLAETIVSDVRSAVALSHALKAAAATHGPT